MFLFTVMITLIQLVPSSASWNHHKGGKDWVTIPNSQCNPLTHHQQSPINIITNDIEYNLPETRQLEFNYPSSIFGGKVINNGHAFKYKLPQQSLDHKTFSFTGGKTGTHRWCLQQFHFHWGSIDSQGSEHLVNNIATPLEVHFVHFDCGFKDVSEAAGEGKDAEHGGERTLAVIGIRYAVTGDEGNAELHKFLKYTQSVINPNENGVTTPEGVSHNFNNLLPTQKDYYFYEGGLTTPNCNQVVNWYVMSEVLPVGADELKLLRSLMNSHGGSLVDNFRLPQPLNGRPVFGFRDSGSSQLQDITTSSTSTSFHFEGSVITSVYNEGTNNENHQEEEEEEEGSPSSSESSSHSQEEEEEEGTRYKRRKRYERQGHTTMTTQKSVILGVGAVIFGFAIYGVILISRKDTTNEYERLNEEII